MSGNVLAVRGSSVRAFWFLAVVAGVSACAGRSAVCVGDVDSPAVDCVLLFTALGVVV